MNTRRSSFLSEVKRAFLPFSFLMSLVYEAVDFLDCLRSSSSSWMRASHNSRAVRLYSFSATARRTCASMAVVYEAVDYLLRLFAQFLEPNREATTHTHTHP